MSKAKSIASAGASVWTVVFTSSEGADVQLFALRSDAETWIRAEADELQEDSDETYDRAENWVRSLAAFL
jgi:hypothetical protein